MSPTNSDDGYAPVVLPFAFAFFGDTYPSGTTIYASTNGTLSFAAADFEQTNTAIPSTAGMDGFVAAFWQDLHLDTLGAMYSAVSGAPGRRVFTIEWSQVAIYAARADKITMQIRLIESDNTIEIAYGARINDGFDDAASVGVENSMGTAGVGLSCVPSCAMVDVPNGTVLTFSPDSPSLDLEIASAAPIPSMVAAGGSYLLDYSLQNNGNSAASAEVGLYVSNTSPVNLNTAALIAAESVNISGGATVPRSLSVTIPSATPSGIYYVALFVDAANVLGETDEFNNEYQLGSTTVGTAPNGNITITTPAVPPAVVGSLYQFQLAQSGGSSPTWVVVSGSPGAGITLSSSGELSGTPQNAGTFTFRVEASQPGYTSGVKDFVLEVTTEDAPLSIETTSLSNAVVDLAYSAQIVARGGVQPYRFEISGGELPAGLSIDSMGRISGIPTSAGASQFEVRVADAENATATRSFTIQVGDRDTLAVTLPDRITLVSKQEVNVPLTARGGMQPYTWSSGVLPDGLRIESGGIRGAATASVANSRVTFVVMDSAGASASKEVELAVTSDENNEQQPRGAGRERSSGCSCEAASSRGDSTWIGVALIAVLLRRRSSVLH